MEELKELRTMLDETDAEILRLFSERMQISERIGRVKRAQSLPIEDPDREREVLGTRLKQVPDGEREGAGRLIGLLMDESKKVQRRGFNLYLIGMPDCGKTRMAKKLHAITGMPTADTDKLIMQTVGKTIDEIFETAGEEGFRQIEASVLRMVAAKGGMTVALGGGTPLYGDNAKVMKCSGITVFLDRKPEKLLGQSVVNRPLLRGATREETDERIMKQYGARHERYLACADLALDPDDEDAAERIAGFFGTSL